MGAIRDLDPGTLKAFETYLGLPADGAYDDELGKRIESYQMLLGQGTPGQTANDSEYSALVKALQDRSAAFGSTGDPTPMQDTGFQSFLRNAGASENEILDEIRFRTEQNSREINRRAAGFAADRAEAVSGFDRERTGLGQERDSGTKRIGADYSNRGFGENSFQQGDVNELNTDIDRRLGDVQGRQAQTLGGIDQQELEFKAGQNDALAEATRKLQQDAAALYRRRADEDLAARDRIGQRQAQGVYGG